MELAVPGRQRPVRDGCVAGYQDRKSTRLNSSHLVISYAVFCLKKKKLTTSSHDIQHLLCALILEAQYVSHIHVVIVDSNLLHALELLQYDLRSWFVILRRLLLV